jgi:hypothetical protein
MEANILLVEISPDMGEEHEDTEYGPTRECAHATGKTSLIQEKADRKRTNNLRNPVQQTVQTAGTDVEKRTVVIVELYDIHSISFEDLIRGKTNAMCRNSWKRRTWGKEARSSGHPSARNRDP